MMKITYTAIIWLQTGLTSLLNDATQPEYDEYEVLSKRCASAEPVAVAG